MNTAVTMKQSTEGSLRFKAGMGVSHLQTIRKQISKQQKSNSMFRRTHGTAYWC
jgi:hypothetical protein